MKTMYTSGGVDYLMYATLLTCYINLYGQNDSLFLCILQQM